jgi:two-component system, LytTR family, response regulator
MTIRTLLVDDEELARTGLRARLERTADISVIGECTNGFEALRAIRKLTPDLVFLDVKMPEMSGLDVAAALEGDGSRHIIFLTAFDTYAIQAFELDALDYLLKPIDDERLLKAIARAREAVRISHEEDLVQRVARAVASLGPGAAQVPNQLANDRFLVRSLGRMIVVRVADVDWIEASDDYVSIHVENKAWLVRETIASVAHRYAAHGIVRIHRSTLVKLDRVKELLPLANNEFTVVLRDGTELKMSRNYREALDSLVGLGT